MVSRNYDLSQTPSDSILIFPDVPASPPSAGSFLGAVTSSLKLAQLGFFAPSAVYIPIAGGTMTGPLILSGDPTVALGAATKQYSDLKLPLAGGQMSGPLSLSGDPTQPLHASTKQYTDTKVALAGGTLTGNLFLNADPTNPTQAATKRYVDQATAAGYLPISGGTLTSPGTLAGVASITFTTTDILGPPTGILPDLVWGLFDAPGGNIAVMLDRAGVLTVAALSAVLTADPTQPLGAATKQYIDNLRSNALPLAGGAASAGVSLLVSRADHTHPSDVTTWAPINAPVFTTSITLGTEVWTTAAYEPDIIWSLRDTATPGSMAMFLDSTGAISIANLTAPIANITNLSGVSSLTGLTTLSATTATFTTATIANEQIFDQTGVPDLIGMVAGSNGNIVSGYDTITGEFNVTSINAGAIKVNGAPLTPATPSGPTALSNTVDVRDPAYGAKGDAQFNEGLVTTSGNTLTLINYHGLITLESTVDPLVWKLTIQNQRWDGWAFQPRHDGKLIYIATDDSSFISLGRVKQHYYGSQCLVTITDVIPTPITNVMASVTCPGFDTAMAVAGKYITVDGMAKEIWGKYDLGTGAALGGRFFDPNAPYGVQTFISAIATVSSGNTVTIANVGGSSPANGTFPLSWTSNPSLVQWGSNDIVAVGTAARAAYDANRRSIAFTGDGNHYLMLGVCGSGQGWGTFIGATAAETSALLNGVYWTGDNVTTCAYHTGGGLYPHRAAAPRSKQPAIPFKLVNGRMSLPRCAAKPKAAPINVLITGDSLGTVNPQSQVAIVMGVFRFFEEFQRQNGSRQCNFYCVGQGGATWASLADPAYNVTSSSPSVIYGIIPKPIVGTFPHRNFYTNINQTSTSATNPIVPDVIAIFNNTGNDRANIDIASMQALVNVIRNIPRADGYGPTDVIFQTDWNHVNFIGQLGTMGGTPLPDPWWGVWSGEYGLTANRTCAANRGFGCIDYAEVISRVSFANDLTRRAMRQIPSVTWSLAPTTPTAIATRCRDFALWFALPGTSDASAFANLLQIEFQLSMSAGNRLLVRRGANGNIWLAVTTYGHFVDTPVTCTAGANTVTVPAVTPTTFTGLVTGKATQIFCQTGVTFDATYEGKCFVSATGNLTASVRRPQRNYLRRLMDANNMTVFDRTFDGGDIQLTAAPVPIGAQQFIAQDSEAMTHVSLIYPDGTLFTSQVAYGSTTTATQATLMDNVPQTLAATTVSMFLGRMCVPWFDTGLAPSATANVGMFEVNVSRGSLGFGYSPDIGAMPIVATTVIKQIERLGGEFNCIVRSKGTQQVVASNMWVDDDTPTIATCPPWELRGWFDNNSAGTNGGTVGHYGSRMRVEVLDPIYAIQDLSTG